MAARSNPLENSRECAAAESVRPEPPQLARRPRQGDRHPLASRQHDAGCGPGEPDGDSSVGQRRLFADTGCEIRIRPPEPRSVLSRDRLDLPLELVVDAQSAARRPRQDLDSAVVVSRAEPSREHADVRLQPLPDRLLQLGLAIADDDDPPDVEPEPDELPREVWAVLVAPVTAHELRARDEDDGPRPPRHSARDGTRTPSAVTVKTVADASSFGKRLPFNVNRRFVGFATATQSFLPEKL